MPLMADCFYFAMLFFTIFFFFFYYVMLAFFAHYFARCRFITPLCLYGHDYSTLSMMPLIGHTIIFRFTIFATPFTMPLITLRLLMPLIFRHCLQRHHILAFQAD